MYGWEGETIPLPVGAQPLGFDAAVDGDEEGFVQFAVVLDRVGEHIRVDLRPGVVVLTADLLHHHHHPAEATVEVRVPLSGILKGADDLDGRGVGGGGGDQRCHARIVTDGRFYVKYPSD